MTKRLCEAFLITMCLAAFDTAAAQDSDPETGAVSASGEATYEPYKPAPDADAPAARSGGGGSRGDLIIKDTSDHRRPMALSVMAYVPWWYGVGIGFSTAFEIPIMHDGFLPNVNDSFSIEPSFGFAYVDYYSGWDDDYALLFRPAVAALWSFHLKEHLRVYGIVNFGYTRVNRYWNDRRLGRDFDDGYNHFYGEAGAGVIWNFAQRWAVRGEVAFHGIRGGINIQF
jgi:hypothetical protein